jgi:hypothetical protein
MWKRDKISQNALPVRWQELGTVGANDIASFLAYQDEIPTRESIYQVARTPPNIPTSAGAIDYITVQPRTCGGQRDHHAHHEIYPPTGGGAASCVLHGTCTQSKSKQKIAFTNKAFTDWARDNQDIL